MTSRADEQAVARTCPLCQGRLGRVVVEIHEPDRFEKAAGISSVDYLRRWVECDFCGALCDVHLSPEAAKLDAWATNYYEVEEAVEPLKQKFDRIMSLPPARSDNRQRVERIHQFLQSWRKTTGGLESAAGRVLDVGAGMGVFLSAFQQRTGWRGTGVEPSPKACDHLRSLPGIEVAQGLFSGQPEFAGFDLITFNKVIEHIREPQATLRAATGAVGAGGVLYVEVPHRLSAECHPPGHFILGALHHHLYSTSSLARLLESTGWLPLECGTVFEPSGKVSAFTFACLPAVAVELGKRRSS